MWGDLVADEALAEQLVTGDRVLATDIHAVWPQTRNLASTKREATNALVAEIPAPIGYAQADPGHGRVSHR